VLLRTLRLRLTALSLSFLILSLLTALSFLLLMLSSIALSFFLLAIPLLLLSFIAPSFLLLPLLSMLSNHLYSTCKPNTSLMCSDSRVVLLLCARIGFALAEAGHGVSAW